MLNYQLIESHELTVNLFWLPGVWFTQNLQRALSQGRIKDNYGVKLIMEVFFIYIIFETVVGYVVKKNKGYNVSFRYFVYMHRNCWNFAEDVVLYCCMLRSRFRFFIRKCVN